jgi:hypothetical protein
MQWTVILGLHHVRMVFHSRASKTYRTFTPTSPRLACVIHLHIFPTIALVSSPRKISMSSLLLDLFNPWHDTEYQEA